MGNLSGCIALLMWGVFPLIILGFGQTPPFLAASLSFLIAGLALILFYKRRGVAVTTMMKGGVKAYILVVSGFCGYIFFLLQAFASLPAFQATTLNYLWPLLLLFFSGLISKKPLSPFSLMAVLLGFGGTCLLFFDGSALLSVQTMGGYASIILACLIWAGYSALTRFVPFQPYHMSGFFLASAGIMMAAHLLSGPDYMPSVGEWVFIILFGLTRLSFVFWDYAMKYGQVLILAPLSYLTPLFAVSGLVLAGYKPDSLLILWGGGLIIAGCLLVNIPLVWNSFKNSKRI